VRNHYGSPCAQFNAGIWGAAGHWTINYTEHEYCEILQGVSGAATRDGNAKTLRATVFLKYSSQGFSGTWEVLEALPCLRDLRAIQQLIATHASISPALRGLLAVCLHLMGPLRNVKTAR
jgi:hypothetical protein